MTLSLKARAITSSLLIFLIIVVTFSGIGLHLAPAGRIARDFEWNFLGIDKEMLENLHTVSGFAMSIVVALHLVLNYKMYINEVKLLFR